MKTSWKKGLLRQTKLIVTLGGFQAKSLRVVATFSNVKSSEVCRKVNFFKPSFWSLFCWNQSPLVSPTCSANDLTPTTPHLFYLNDRQFPIFFTKETHSVYSFQQKKKLGLSTCYSGCFDEIVSCFETNQKPAHQAASVSYHWPLWRKKCLIFGKLSLFFCLTQTFWKV